MPMRLASGEQPRQATGASPANRQPVLRLTRTGPSTVLVV